MGTALEATNPWDSEAIIGDCLSCRPDVKAGSAAQGWKLSRWRNFVGSYALPELPAPIYVVHLAGKREVKMWDGTGWSERSSRPSDATIMPSHLSSRWLVDGELDVVTLTFPEALPIPAAARGPKFAFVDQLGVTLTRQVVAALYEPASDEREAYVDALMTALKAHVTRSAAGSTERRTAEIPIACSSAHRLHQIMGLIRAHPERDHDLEELAQIAGVTPSHFCRIFLKATGITPHRYVMKTKLDCAEHKLRESELAMSQIAEFLGFKGQAHFTRAFRQHRGETPSAYRQRVREV